MLNKNQNTAVENMSTVSVLIFSLSIYKYMRAHMH